MQLKKIVVIGPESTGKSTLSQQLAEHYKTSWIPEYAREYLEKKGAHYHYEDLYEIAKGQMQLEDDFTTTWHLERGKELNKTKYKLTGPAASHLGYPLILDTNLYVMKVWSEIAFNKCDNRILTQLALRQYDLYLLCNPDLPWTPDNLREYPDLKTREGIYQHYKDVMVNQHTAWTDITGTYEERFQQAVIAIDYMLKPTPKV
jgi:nicotinamide riboside kinase